MALGHFEHNNAGPPLNGYRGSRQLTNLSDLAKAPDASISMIVVNLLLSLLSVGAPVWFAWLATKQIGQRFRLAEDIGTRQTDKAVAIADVDKD